MISLFKNHSLRTKIFLSFSVVVVVYALFSILVFFQIRTTLTYVDNTVPSVKNMNDLHTLSKTLDDFEKNLNKLFVVQYAEHEDIALDLMDDIDSVLEKIKGYSTHMDSILQKKFYSEEVSSLSFYIVDLRTYLERYLDSLEGETQKTNKNEVILSLYSSLDESRGSSVALVNYVSDILRSSIIKEQELLSDVYKLVFVFGFLLILLGVFVTDLLSRIIIKPVVEVRDMARKVGKGNFNVKSKIRSTDELGELAKSIENMGAGLKDKFAVEEHSRDLEDQLRKRTEILEVRVKERTSELDDAKTNLEEKVKERTADLESAKNELEEKIESLELFQRVTVDRENKMIELKEEIRKLEEKLGE